MQSKSEPRATSSFASLPAPSAVCKPPRLPYLDGLRAVAALYVVLHHVALHTHSTTLNHNVPGAYWLQFGRLAVVLFIVLSGYCLALPVACNGGVMRQNVMEFYLRRARRILPPYYAALLFSVLCIVFLIGEPTGTHWDSSLPLTSDAILTRLLLVQDWAGGGAINHVFWSIATECHIYLLFPLWVWAWKRWGSLLVIFGTGAACVLLSRLPAAVLGAFPIGFVFFFVLGMGAAFFAHSPRLEQAFRRFPAAMLWAVCALVELVLLARWGGDFRPALTETLFAVLSALLLLMLAQPQGKFLRAALDWKPLVFVGGFSYSLYLIHAPLIQIAWKWGVRPFALGEMPAFGLLCLLALPLSVVAAYGFFLLFERPFMTVKRARTAAVTVPN